MTEKEFNAKLVEEMSKELQKIAKQKPKKSN